MNLAGKEGMRQCHEISGKKMMGMEYPCATISQRRHSNGKST